MGCQNRCGCVSTVLSQEVGSAYYYVRLVADNIELLKDLAAQMGTDGDVLDIARGTSSVVVGGMVTADPDNTHIAVIPEAGFVDEITTIDGDPDGRVILLVPESESYTVTLKAQIQKAIESVQPLTDQFTVTGHGLTTGQLMSLSGPGLAAEVAPGAYYAIVTGADTFKVATTKADALAGIAVELVTAGAGYLEVGNLKLDGDFTLTGRQSAMLVKDGHTYTLMSTSAVLPALVNLTNERQPLNALLTSISELVLAGHAGKFIEINATEDGFEVLDYGLEDLTADLLAKADKVHTHTISDITGLQAALDSKQSYDGDLAAIAALSTTTFGRSLLELVDVNALNALLGTGSGSGGTGGSNEAPDAAISATLVSWTDQLTVKTSTIRGATSYRWRFYLADGTTLRRELITDTPRVSYTSSQAANDGISRSYKVQVAGVNDLGTGPAFMSAVFNKSAPVVPTSVAFADGASSSTVTFTAPFDPNIVGYLITYSTVSGFNPMNQGAMFKAGGSPAYTPQLPAATYYGKIASYDEWSARPDLLNFSTQDSFVISTGTGGTPSGGDGGGGYTGGGGGGLSGRTVTDNA